MTERGVDGMSPPKMSLLPPPGGFSTLEDRKKQRNGQYSSNITFGKTNIIISNITLFVSAYDNVDGNVNVDSV